MTLNHDYYGPQAPAGRTQNRERCLHMAGDLLGGRLSLGSSSGEQEEDQEFKKSWPITGCCMIGEGISK